MKVDTGTEQLLCEVREGVAIITLNRPEARNALSDDLSPALRRMLRQMGDDDGVGAILITGAGTAFCAGGDVKGMAGRSPTKAAMTPEERVADLKERQRLLTGAIVTSPKPVVAALPGPAAGAGLAIALACDVRFASDTAFVATGYARVGLSGDYGISWLLTRLVGTARARELMYSGEKVSAERCEAMGIVNHVVPGDELFDRAFDFALRIANGPRAAISGIKANLDRAAHAEFLAALDQEAEILVPLTQHPDHKEAVAAFVGKRAPVFGKG
jgi:enoyl-CoA hydratase/carnithine racemase